MIRKITISLSLLLAAAAVVPAQNTTTLSVVVPAGSRAHGYDRHDQFGDHRHELWHALHR